MDIKSKLCPILSANKDKKCIGYDCAWWDEKKELCVTLSALYHLDWISHYSSNIDGATSSISSDSENIVKILNPKE